MKPNSFITLFLVLLPWPAFAQATRPAIGLSTDIEDGKKMVQAIVTLNGKPMNNVGLQYFAQRTFGNLVIGKDTTLDDGTSAVAFPSDLPGGPDGKIHVIARITAPAQYLDIIASASFPADVQPPRDAASFPRALWAPHAPLMLMLSIFVILAGVWISYLFVISRILAIRMGGR